MVRRSVLTPKEHAKLHAFPATEYIMDSEPFEPVHERNSRWVLVLVGLGWHYLFYIPDNLLTYRENQK
jgi:hypothetical protein